MMPRIEGEGVCELDAVDDGSMSIFVSTSTSGYRYIS